MENTKNDKPKSVITAAVTPFEKSAFKNWWRGKFASEADAIRSHVRKVIEYDPESQGKTGIV